jgi:hypothetical protein
MKALLRASGAGLFLWEEENIKNSNPPWKKGPFGFEGYIGVFPYERLWNRGDLASR